MFCLKHFLVVILCLQLSLFVVSQSNTTQNAEEALQVLRSQIGSSNELMSTTIPNMWQSYVDNSTDAIRQQLVDDMENLKNWVNYITPFISNSTNEECLNGLKLDVSNYSVQVAAREQQIFNNLHSLANAQFRNILKKYNIMYIEFVDCQKTDQNCDGINEGIIAEVERLIPVLERIPNELLIETHVLGYKIGVNWELIQSILMIDYTKVIQNATVCLLSQIEEEEFSLNSTPREGDILQEYLNLSSAVDKAYLVTQIDLIFSMISVMTRAQGYYNVTNNNIRDAIFRANQTINALLSVPQSLNITVNCSTPDLQSQVNSSLGKTLDEYRAIIEVIGGRYDEAVQLINITRNEVKSIRPQVHGCSTANSSCDYVSEKIAQKMVEVPLTIQKMENATMLLMYQSIPDVWNSGSKTVRDILEDLEGGIVGLKSCIRLSFY